MTRDPLADFDHEILDFLQSAGVDRGQVQLSTPPEREFGERSTNAPFLLARERRQAPREIADALAARFAPSAYRFLTRVESAGNGFLNFHLNYTAFVSHAIEDIGQAGSLYGRRSGTTAQRVIVEHTSVNPNKEWHVGHVRNAILGDVVGRLFRLAGHDVEIQNYIDDTGLQAAQAIVGLEDFPETPLPGEKQDHYVGRLYVKIAAELGAEQRLRERLAELQSVPVGGHQDSDDAGELESIKARLDNLDRLKARAMEVMHRLEQGEYFPVTRAILDAQLQTAYRLGVYYDLLNWESHLVHSRLFDEAMTCLQQSAHVLRPEAGRYAGALVIETAPPREEGDEPKYEVLIRSNGIPTYVAKDIAYHMWKFGVLPDRLRYVEFRRQPNDTILWSTSLEGTRRKLQRPDEVINVIAVNQSQAQDAVKSGLRAAGFEDAADDLVHLAYGLVSTAEGKLSGRRGTAVAGDWVIDEAVRVAFERVQEKRSQDLTDDEMRAIAEAVGVGSVRYFMVQYNPLRDIVFDVRDVVSYDGNTALYIQYALVRMFAILRKASAEHGVSEDEITAADASLLQHEQEKRLVYHLVRYPELVADASRTLGVNLVAEFGFDLATIFSQFYRDCKVLNAESTELRNARLLLVRSVRDVLTNVCDVLGVPVIERL